MIFHQLLLFGPATHPGEVSRAIYPNNATFHGCQLNSPVVLDCVSYKPDNITPSLSYTQISEIALSDKEGGVVFEINVAIYLDKVGRA